MSNLEDYDQGRIRHYGMLLGVVTAVDDPEGLHRIKAKIPGIADPETDWLFPITSGGGGPERGGHVAPDIGHDVCIWFHQGDTQAMGVYACGWWGVPDEGTEMPHGTKQAAKDAHLVQALRVGRIVMMVDEREGQEAFKVYDAKGAFSFQVDLETKRVALEGLTSVLIKSVGQLALEGLEVLINGRRVNSSGSPI